MTPEAQRIAIALAHKFELRDKFGVKKLYYKGGQVALDCEYNSRGQSIGLNWEQSILKFSPDYLNDLNAMHEAEKVVWIDRYRYDYNNNLDRVVDATPVKGSESKIGPWIYEYNKARRATASQRAEAFLRTLSLWKY